LCFFHPARKLFEISTINTSGVGDAANRIPARNAGARVMSTNLTIIIFAVVAAISLFTLGQWFNADATRAPLEKQACQRDGAC
jgi:hypothetical protein